MWLLSSAAWLLAAVASADLGPFWKSRLFDEGEYGNYPTEKFATTESLGPRMNWIHRSSSCYEGYLFFGPRGFSVPQPGQIILDHRGHLVYQRSDWGQVYNFQTQMYKGEQVLTFWAGDDSVRGHGAGEYHMLNNSYHEIKIIQAGNGLAGDLHEFLITQDDTAIITVYQNLAVDFSPNDESETLGYIWDCLFQELDLETNEILFQWRASDHLGFADSSRGFGSHFIPDDAMDWFHMNSIDKDPDGNYLVSARYTQSAMKIDGKTGEIIWMLGGVRNNFRDLSGGKATKFIGQHDARWADNYTGVTLFDNAKDWDYRETDRKGSRGVRVALNFDDMTATLRGEYNNPKPIQSSSQGSTRILPNGNVLLGYGYNGAYTEYDGDGHVLCEAHFMPAKDWDRGDVQSYRTLKHPWVGWPRLEWLKMVVGTDGAFVSWNGATEVKTWRLQQGDVDLSEDADFEDVRDVPKDGYETHFLLGQEVTRDFVRVQGLDKDGKVLGTSNAVSTNATEALKPDNPIYPNELKVPEELKEPQHDAFSALRDWWVYIIIGVIAILALAFGVRRWTRSSGVNFQYKPVEKPPKGELSHDQDELLDSEDELEEV